VEGVNIVKKHSGTTPQGEKRHHRVSGEHLAST